MSTEILINASTHEARAAVVENGVLQEVFLERASRRGLISNIYKGRVSRVLPGMQAAFIDIGMERTAFLHASDIFDARHADTGIEPPHTENIRSWSPRATRSWCRSSRIRSEPREPGLPPTSPCLPGTWCTCRKASGVGVSARIENEAERERLRAAVQAGLEPAGQGGFIVRTAAEDSPAEALRADMLYLRKLWEFVRQKGLRTQPGNLVHADLPLHLRVLRDLLRPDVDRVLIDQPSAHREMLEFAAAFMPDALPRIELYGGDAAAVRAAPRRGGNSKGAGPQGVVEIRRSPDHRSNRGDDHHRRQHRRVRRPSKSRGNHLPHQSRGGGDHREAAAAAQSRRHHHHRFHRHGGIRASPAGHPGAGKSASTTITSRPIFRRCRRWAWWK